MVVTQVLNYTPRFTTSTLQFKSEVANIIVTSILAVLILANIVSAVSKAVYFTKHFTFNYDDWLRAFIFANSDDPLRIISWLRRKYDYREPHWSRARNHLRLSRLFVPFLARIIILLASIASIAVTIPGEKVLSACDREDYSLRLNTTQAHYTPAGDSTCTEIPLRSDLGSVRSSASYCQCPNFSFFEESPSGKAAVAVSKSTETGAIIVLAVYNTSSYAHSIYVEWKDLENSHLTYRSNIDSIDLESLGQVALAAVTEKYTSCTLTSLEKEEEDGRLFAFLDNCFLGGEDNERTIDAANRMEGYIRTGLFWSPISGSDRRIKFDQTPNVPRTFVNDCPLQVTVVRPLMNIVPLAIALVLWCFVNLIVSLIVSKNGHNVLDAGFHIIKEVLGHDCTSNPLEENKARNENKRLEFRKWICQTSGGGGHAGYIGREGDTRVADFGSDVVVGGCDRAVIDLNATSIHSREGQNPNTPGNDSSANGPASSQVMSPATVSGAQQGGLTVTPSGTIPYPAVPVSPYYAHQSPGSNLYGQTTGFTPTSLPPTMNTSVRSSPHQS